MFVAAVTMHNKYSKSTTPETAPYPPLPDVTTPSSGGGGNPQRASRCSSEDQHHLLHAAAETPRDTPVLHHRQQQYEGQNFQGVIERTCNSASAKLSTANQRKETVC